MRSVYKVFISNAYSDNLGCAKSKEIGMNKLLVVILGFVVLLSGCDRGSDDPVYGVAADDKEMNTAIAEARSTVADFVARLQDPKSTDEGFSVKKMITDGDKVEHFWLDDISYSNGYFSGYIGNDPQSVSSIKFGQEVSVAETEITDWMYLDNGKMVGNFTLRVLLKRMPKEEADRIRAQFQIKD